MPRTRQVDPKKLDAWLRETLTGPSAAGYTHRLLKEQAGARAVILDELGGYVREAHEDAVHALRNVLEPTLAPFATNVDDPAFGYPADLHIDTLMGYFGEIFAGLLAEHKAVNGQQPWQIPAFLFRFHRVAFQKLQMRRDLQQQQITPEAKDSSTSRIPGRTGNDVLAFRVGSDGKLVGLLICEAKCFSAHNMAKAKAAHGQLTEFSKIRCPSGVSELVELLADRAGAAAEAWVGRLRQFMFDAKQRVPRSDAIVYVTGNSPTTRATWLGVNVAASEYKASGPLEVLEVHVSDPQGLVRALYRPNK